MRTKLLTLIILLTGLNCYSQLDGYKKLTKGQCKINHKCNTEYKYDDFDEIWHYNTSFTDNALSKDGLSYIISKTVDKKNNKQQIELMLWGNSKGCRTKESYVHIQFKNGEKIKISNAYTDIDCGISMISIKIDDYIDLLQKEPIEKIRIFLDGNEDFIISEKEQVKFFNNLKCIKNIDIS
ncbi:hypothetical protein ACHRVZ_00810 [Flavobacterium sp. FlaQc-57]|uniref:hypothetical protein n=1 Tax=Flavobacterium sp. FlaQc-57 TaxID=3374186 RepID=UPI003756BC15